MGKATYNELYTIKCWGDIKKDLMDALIQYGLDEDYEDEIEDVIAGEEFDMLIDMVWGGDSKEKLDNDYLLTTYILDLTETIALSFTLSQYRKDGGLCDSDSPDEITVLERIEKPKKSKVNKLLEKRAKIDSVIDNSEIVRMAKGHFDGETTEQMIQELKDNLF